MKVLVIGSGGREHALVWKLKQSPRVKEIFCAPGNAGIAELATLVSIQADDVEELFRFAAKNRIALTVVGPEVPLVKGIVDRFERDGLKIFGPSKRAAELEGSKAFAKQFMKKYGIPTAGFEIFSKSQFAEAENFIQQHVAPIVVKADGLAAGKGAVVCQTRTEALNVLGEFFRKNIFGEAGSTAVIEEFMQGEEASVFVLTDGSGYRILQPAQDHKQILDGDRGKNTGGMGAYAPAPVVTKAVLKRVEEEIVQPVLRGMREEGRTYKGCLYVGLMVTSGRPKVVEFNCRFGDPEAQAVLPLVDGDLLDILSACADGGIGSIEVKFHDASAVCVVMASRGYPDAYETGKAIHGLENIRAEDGVVVFHAATRKENESFVTAGGRVLGVTAIGYRNDLEGTINAAYSAVKRITFDGAYYRSDIGKKGVQYFHLKE
ncbi:MAG: phosphoribosylamine--glycine ligase [Bacteroidota bacterium]|nr:phosphoribosylamine--glycine ligase [Bacteroidota bacterium]